MSKQKLIVNLTTYFEDKLNLKNLSIKVLQYQRTFCLKVLYDSYLHDLLKEYYLFGFQKKSQGFFSKFFSSSKQSKNIVFWNEFDFWKYFQFPTFNYSLVYGKDIFNYQKGNVVFSDLDNSKRKQRSDIKDWKNKYLLVNWWKRNDNKLYVEEKDKFNYLPDEDIKLKFIVANNGNLIFTSVLPFGNMAFVKINNILLMSQIVIFKNNQKICLNLFFYYFFKSNAYLFENNIGSSLGSPQFSKHGFDESWMIIPKNLFLQANYVKVFSELENQIIILRKLKLKTRNLLYFLGKNCLNEKEYSLGNLIQKRDFISVSEIRSEINRGGVSRLFKTFTSRSLKSYNICLKNMIVKISMR